MVFFDGTNALCSLARYLGLELDAHHPQLLALNYLVQATNGVAIRGNAQMIRRYWCGAYRGEEEYGNQLAEYLHQLTCQATLLKVEGRQEKGVDMAVATHLLVNAFHKNFDIAWLVAGDADYTMLVHEAKRYGGVVNGAFFTNGLSDELRRSFDEFHALEEFVHSATKSDPKGFATLPKKKPE